MSKYATANVRRLYDHVKHGGKIKVSDMDQIVKYMEDKDTIIDNLIGSLEKICNITDDEFAGIIANQAIEKVINK